MKFGKTIVIGALSLILISKAQALTCKAQLVHTVCGSGKIELSMDQKSKQFDFHNGDVGCWYSDYQVKGTLKKTKGEHPFNFHSTFQLLIVEIQTNQTISYGSFIYDDQLKVARLILNRRDEGEISSTYDLTCND